MSLNLNPPPLQVPSSFSANKEAGAFFTALINTLYQVWNSLYSIRVNVKTKTTDAATTGIVRIPVKVDRTMMIVANLVARRTGGASGTIGDSDALTAERANSAGTGGYRCSGRIEQRLCCRAEGIGAGLGYRFCRDASVVIQFVPLPMPLPILILTPAAIGASSIS